MAYYEQAFADGRLRVSGGNNVGLRDPLLNGMAVHHYLHRHEPPVLDVHIPVRPLPLLVTARSTGMCAVIFQVSHTVWKTLSG